MLNSRIDINDQVHKSAIELFLITQATLSKHLLALA